MKSIFPILIFFFGVILLGFLNWQSGTFLTGGDNLHPEFAFDINLKRSIFAVWQEYQGLGLLGGMGHASDFVHQIFLFFLSFVFPIQTLRYLWTFFMLFTGGVGAYYLTKRVINSKQQIVPYLGGTFYLLNMATLQAFYTPFEVFSVHYSVLPWLFLTFINVFLNLSKKNFLLFVLVLILATPAAYVPTLFVVYLLSIVILLLSFFFTSGKKYVVATGAKVFVAIIIINLFWLLPFSYFTVTSASNNLNSKINQMATEDIFLKNQAFGKIEDVALLKGFWFNNIEPNMEGKFTYMLEPWRSHMANPVVQVIGYSLFAISLLGFILSLRKKNFLLLAFAMLWLFAFTMLTTATPPFSWIDALFRKIPLFDQAFRFTFTKFSILAALMNALFFAYGAEFLLSRVRYSYLRLVFISFLFIAFGIFMFPVLRGHLFYDKARLRIPNEYFETFDFFRKQDENTRIANFPQYTFWDWNFYNWGYGGSGFLWYGIKQPILGRAFDSWSQKNEDYYWEISYAIYSQNTDLFNNVLQKYNVQWLLVDKNVINPSSPKALYIDELEKMLASSNKIILAQQFGGIKIYRVTLDSPLNNFVYATNTLPTVGPYYQWINVDNAYTLYGNYVTQAQNSVYYPFRSLFTGRSSDERDFELEDGGDHFTILRKLPADFSNYYVTIPEFTNSELRWIDPKNLARYQDMAREVFFNGQEVQVRVPKVSGYLSAQINPGVDMPVDESSRVLKNCNSEISPQIQNEVINNNGQSILRVSAVNSNNCSAEYWLPNLPNELGYIIIVKSQNIQGKPLLFWIENLNARRSDLEVYLPKNNSWQTSYFIQPPMEHGGQGYTLHFDNISIGNEKTVNDLGKITVNVVPYNFLMGIMLKNWTNTPQQNIEYTSVQVAHPNQSLYEVEIPATSGNSTVVLSQAYEQGWKAYQCTMQSVQCRIFPFLFGREITDHVLMNNWENGWVVPSGTQKIIIIFLPQYLEYFGFLVLFGYAIWLWRLE